MNIPTSLRIASRLCLAVSVLAVSGLTPTSHADESKPTHAYPEWEAKITGATIEVPDDITEFVAHPVGATADEGLPLPEAMAKALSFAEGGEAVRVRLLPGVYRSKVFVRSKDATGLLVVEGPADGSAVIKGSEDWSAAEKWTADSANPWVLEATWTKEWDDMDIEHREDRADAESPFIRATLSDKVSITLDWKSGASEDASAGASNAAGGSTWKLYRQAVREDKRKRYEGNEVKKADEWKLVYEGDATTYTDTKVKKSQTWDSTTYHYRVVEVGADGSESGHSNVVGAKPGDRSNSARPDSLGRRREMVFVDGVRLRQVLGENEVEPGTYFVDDGFPHLPEDGRLIVGLPDGKTLGTCQIEVGVQENEDWRFGPMWLFRDKENMVLRNLTFTHYPSYLHSASPLLVNDCRNVLVENCTFEWNGGSGFVARTVSDFTMRNLQANNNGGSGIQFNAGANIIAEDITTNNNNWRGDWGKIYSWAYGGIKCGFGFRDVIIRRHASRENKCHGLWIDYNTKRLLIDDCDIHDNKEFGFFIEALHGPTILRNNRTTGNRFGIHLANSAKGVLHNNISWNNKQYQIHMHERWDRPVSDQELNPNKDAKTPGASGSTYYVPVNIEEWTWTDNVIVSTDPEKKLVSALDHQEFFDTLKADYNLYYHPQPDGAFKIGQLTFDFSAWREITGQEVHSVMADPLFANADELDFSVKKGSPLLNKKSWEAVENKDGGYHNLVKQIFGGAERLNAKKFPAAENAAEDRWLRLDLSGVVNRPLAHPEAKGADFDNKRQFWARSPLNHLPAGSHTFHGVPFEVAKSEKLGGASGVILESMKVKQSPDGKVPTYATVEFPETKVASVYVLHMLTHVRDHTKMGQYVLTYADGSTAVFDIVNFGPGSDDGPTAERMKEVSLVQDWWPTLTHFESENAMPVMVLDPNKVSSTLRYLYTAQLRNPHPEKLVKSVTVETLYPDRSATLTLIAATVLKAKE